MLSLTGIGHRYAGGPWVVRGLDLEVEPGQVVGVVGPSGSGKSTVLRIASLQTRPVEGEVRLAGGGVRQVGVRVPARLRRRVAFVHQSPRAAVDPRLRLGDVIAEPIAHAAGSLRLGPAARSHRVRDLAARFQLGPDLLDRRPHQVSDGQLQRAVLARAVALTPDVLVVDEPTAMLDAPTTAVVAAVVREEVARGAAVLIASHDAPLLEALPASRLVRLGG